MAHTFRASNAISARIALSIAQIVLLHAAGFPCEVHSAFCFTDHATQEAKIWMFKDSLKAIDVVMISYATMFLLIVWMSFEHG